MCVEEREAPDLLPAPFSLALPRYHGFMLRRRMDQSNRLAAPAPRLVVIPAVHGVFRGLLKSLVKAITSLSTRMIVPPLPLRDHVGQFPNMVR